MNLLYVAGHSDLGASQKFGKAALGLMAAWALNYMSVCVLDGRARVDDIQVLAPVRAQRRVRPAAVCPGHPADVHRYEHALRRSFISASCFNLSAHLATAVKLVTHTLSFHWPLCASLVLASAACGRMIANDEVDKAVHWQVISQVARARRAYFSPGTGAVA